jgi:hypothetical protein
MKFQQSGCLCAAKRTGRLGPSAETVKRVRETFVRSPHKSTKVSSDVVLTHHVTRHNTPIHNILSTAPQLSISQKALKHSLMMAM